MPILPIKDYLYLGAILVLLIGFWAYTHHERALGAAAVVASDQKAVQAQRERDTALQSRAALATSIQNGDFDRVIQVPITDAPVPNRLCSPARGSGSVPNAASSDSGGKTSPVSGTEDASATAALQQFADAAVQIARDADAQVTALQADLQILRTEMEQANAPAK
jgi:hypothetical protein